MFDLPKSSLIKSVVPKNSFDNYTNTHLKRFLADQVRRMSWLNKLSQDTINLKGENVVEIQVFHIELKEKIEIPDLLLMINRAIPYHIVFVVSYEDEVYLSASMKHPHPTRENIDVVTDTATTDWMKRTDMLYKFELTNSLDVVFNRFFLQIKNVAVDDDEHIDKQKLERIIEIKSEVERLENEVKRAKVKVNRTKQANRQLEYYEELRGLERQLEVKTRELKKDIKTIQIKNIL